MRALPYLLTGLLVSSAAVFAACGGTTAETGGDAGGGKLGDAGAACTPCLADNDCNGGVCAQFASDSYCAKTCAQPSDCAGGFTCSTLTTSAGAQASVCVPNADVCGASVGPVADAGPPAMTCGTLVGPTVSAGCHCTSSSSHTCQANGCYGGWYCDTSTNKCATAPATCGGEGGAGGQAYDAGGPVSGSVGANGGSLSRLYFAVVGDTRPPNVDDTAGYPTAIIDSIYADIVAMNPMPAFVGLHRRLPCTRRPRARRPRRRSIST